MALKLWVTLAACVVVARRVLTHKIRRLRRPQRLPAGGAGREASAMSANGGTPASNAGSVTNPAAGSATSKAGGAVPVNGHGGDWSNRQPRRAATVASDMRATTPSSLQARHPQQRRALSR